ncbi:MAG TPA: esterase-like activity of phytase family protein [Gryllotalpicola sp.]
MKRTTRTLAVAAIVSAGLVCAAPAFAGSGFGSHPVQAPNHFPGKPAPKPSSAAPRTDAFTVTGGVTSVLNPQANDPKGLQIVGNTTTAHGAITLQSDGTYLYTPDTGFHGVDSFSYSTSDAVSLYSTDIAPLGTVTGVNISGGAFGSSVTMAPNSSNIFYGLTDRGPNVNGPGGTKVEPLPDFDPAIGEFAFGANGQATLLKTIPLTAKDGSPMNGLENPEANAGETITDMNGNVLPDSADGLDSEGIVALPDGTFWISDEYGPYIVHFDRNGRELSRLSPYDGTLPRELKYREPNKGMEGLTITPDGSTLVGMMQSALTIDPGVQAKSASVPFTRVVTYNLRTKATHEYAYVLDDPASTGAANSEITALSNTKFLVDERDGNFEPGADKKVYEIDLAKASDIGPAAHVKGARYDATKGLEIGGKPLEDLFTSASQSPDGQAVLTASHITPVTKSLYLDLGGLVSRLNPAGAFFGHDKVEGIDLFAGGTKLLVSNDSDFGIDGLADASGALSTSVTPPFTLHSKILPNGQQDDGEYLVVDLAKVKDPVKTAKVSIDVK